MADRKEKATYTFGHHASVVNSHARRTAQDSAAFLLPHLQPHFHILDVGCGPGTITADLAELVPQGKVIGVDFVESVLETARAHVQGRPNSSSITNIVFEAVDANALPYADGTFDVVFCHQVLQHVSDPVGILKEMKRVAKPGGIVAAREADYKSFAWFPEPEGMDYWLDCYRKTARACGGQPDAGRYVRQVSKGEFNLLIPSLPFGRIYFYIVDVFCFCPAVKIPGTWNVATLFLSQFPLVSYCDERNNIQKQG